MIQLLMVRVRVEIMGSQKYRNVGKSQWVLLIMINPIVSTRTRSSGNQATKPQERGY
jgi:hypothetical protein